MIFKITKNSVNNDLKAFETCQKMTFIICLVPRPHYSARPMRIGSRCLNDLRHRNALTEKEGKTPHRDAASSKCR